MARGVLGTGPCQLPGRAGSRYSVLEKVRSEGGAVEMEFRNQGPKPAGFCSDPFGNGFCVIGERVADR